MAIVIDAARMASTTSATLFPAHRNAFEAAANAVTLSQ